MNEDLTGFYGSDDRQFFVGASGMVMELLAPDEVDGPTVAAPARLPLSATPLDERFVLPSFILRVALHLGLQVTPPLDQGQAMAILDEIFWRRDRGGWADATFERECGASAREHLRELEASGLIVKECQRARLTPACLDQIDRLSVVTRGRRFPQERA